MKFAKWTAVILLIFTALGGFSYWAAAKLSDSFTSSHLHQADERWRSEFEHHKTRIEADLQLLTNDPIYRDLARIKNAEPAIRTHLTWEGDRSGSAPEGVEFENETKIKDFTERHPLKDLSSKSWAAIGDDPELESLKLSWLDDLISYDHFNMATHPSHLQAIEDAKTANGIDKIAIASSVAYPNLVALKGMATLRFAQLQKNGKAEEGAKIYRHVSHLIWTSNSLVGSMTAMTMLKFEHALEKAQGSYPLPLIENERIEAMRGLSWFWGGTYRSLLLSDYFGPLKDYFTPETGACSGASESLAGTSGFETFFGGPAAWMEQDFTASFKRVRAVEEKIIRMCGMEAYRPFYESAQPGSNPMFVKNLNAYAMTSPAKDLTVPNPALIPFVRRAAGAILMSVALPSAFSVYNKREREPASK